MTSEWKTRTPSLRSFRSESHERVLLVAARRGSVAKVKKNAKRLMPALFQLMLQRKLPRFF
jgi:hypothetical protein